MRLINDLIETSRLAVGKLTVDRKRSYLEPTLKEIETIFIPMLQEKRISFSLNIEPNLPQAYVDPPRLNQILFNLLGNAMKFTHPEGKITVGAERHKEKKDQLLFSVLDTGIGIDSSEKEKIFERLYQTKKSDASQKKGLGLGLYICQQLVQMHEGKIWVESELGKGTKFLFTIPIFSLKKLILPMLNDEEFDKKPIYLMTLAIESPTLKVMTDNQIKAVTKTVKDVVLDELFTHDIVLPEMNEEASKGIFFTLLWTDVQGTEIVKNRISKKLQKYNEILIYNLNTQISFHAMPISDKKLSIDERAQDLTEAIEKQIDVICSEPKTLSMRRG